MLTEESEKYSLEQALSDIGGVGPFHIVNSLMSIIHFAVGSQFYYSMPFYQKYPDLTCTTSSGEIIENCDRELACTFDKIGSDIQSFEFNQTGKTTFQNFMTDFNLVCTDRSYIGLMGSISFISFAIGSALITRVADTHGRRKVVIFSSLLTPIGLAILIMVKNLWVVYTVLFVVGLTYNSRGSTAYIQAREFLPKKYHMAFVSVQFLIVGVNMCATAVFFS